MSLSQGKLEYFVGRVHTRMDWFEERFGRVLVFGAAIKMGEGLLEILDPKP